MNSPHPTLRRRLGVHIASMILGLLILGIAAAIGIDNLHTDMGVALQGYRQLRQLYDVGFDVTTAKQSLATNPARSKQALESAAAKLEMSYMSDDVSSAPPGWIDESKREVSRLRLREAIDRPDADSIGAVLGEFADITTDVRRTIVARQAAADRIHRATLASVISVCVVVIVTMLIVGVRLYRSVIRPLENIRTGVRHFTAGRFDQRISPHGDREFASIADDFNHMAGELQGLYQQLEQKVVEKSRQLVRSARLASVGYLAAGVAHEINNPLGIIAGYGERSLQLLEKQELNENSLPRTKSAIKIMCEEAFRCKGITDRLLALARPGAENRSAVKLSRVAEDVVSILGGMPEFSDRRVVLECSSTDDLTVRASEGELKQVVLNLLLNALEAVKPNGGEVRLVVRRDARGEIELSVIDNGKGMTSETIDRVFEPFFTDKLGAAEGRHGSGLGLSITHAIVDDLGGRIHAESEGPGRRSKFVVRLPSNASEVKHVVS